MSAHAFYLTNYFLTYTEHSRKKMIDVVSFFMSAISEGLPDVELQDIFDRTDPLFTVYKTKFDTWKLAKETYQGSTLLLTLGFGEFQGKLEKIESKVIDTYTSKSDEYKSIFRDGMDIYYKDTYYQRIQNLGYLRDRLGLYVPVAAAKIIATDLHLHMTDLRDKQQQKAKKLKEASDDLELSRIDIADMMYGNVGILMNKFRKFRDKIASFFNLDVLYGRSARASNIKKYHLDIAVASSSRTAILITDKTVFEFNNSGNVLLRAYTASTEDAPLPLDALPIDADEVLTVKPNTMGAITNTWLIIYNEDLNFSGSIDITEIN
jgi:hypothetical protein